MFPGWNISAARKRSGQAERVRHHPGRKSKVSAEVEGQVLNWLRERTDLTLEQLQAKLHKQPNRDQPLSERGLAACAAVRSAA